MRALLITFLALMLPLPAKAERQSLDDAWWTGPMLANSAGAMPRGHLLIESYLYDVHRPKADSFGSQTYILYSFTDRFTAGIIPNFGYNRGGGAANGNLGVGDLTLHAQYALTRYDPATGTPAIALALEETLPTGRYDRLGTRPADGLGGGAYTTTLSLYTQDYFWLPGGRILRGRFNVSQSLSGSADVRDVSVYGTATGFRGKARPGPSTYFVNSWEYSLTRSWVLAVDLTYRRTGRTRITPDGGTPIRTGRADSFGIAPAVEYSWSPTVGVLVGTRFIPKSRNTSSSVTPAVALNLVL